MAIKDLKQKLKKGGLSQEEYNRIVQRIRFLDGNVNLENFPPPGATAETGLDAGGDTSAQDPQYNVDVPVAGKDLGINDKTGQIDSDKAVPTVTGAAQDDTNKNFEMQNPELQTDVAGNTQNITFNPETGQVTIKQEGGKAYNTTMDAFMKSVQGYSGKGPLDLSAERQQLQGNQLDLSGAPQILQTGDVRDLSQQAADANYQYITKNYQRDKQREMEEAKQMLAERGIPIDPSEGSLWNKTLQSIDEKYQGLDDQAKNQAISKANETTSTLLSGQNQAYQSFLQGAGQQFQSGLDTFGALSNSKIAEQNSGLAGLQTLAGATQQFSPTFTAFQGGQSTIAPNLQQLLGTISSADMAKYGIDQDTMTRLKQIAASKASGGSSGSGDSSVIIGGSAAGFSV